MKIPHKLEIKPGVIYYVAFVSKFDDPDQIGNCANGEEVAAGRTIFIHNELTPAQQYEIFIHELLHAIEFEYGVRIPHRLIYDLQGPLSFVLKQNPEMVVVPTAAKLTKSRKKAKAKKKRG